MGDNQKNLLRNLLTSKNVYKGRTFNRSSSNNTDMLSRLGECFQNKNEFILEFEREDRVQSLMKEIQIKQRKYNQRKYEEKVKIVSLSFYHLKNNMPQPQSERIRRYSTFGGIFGQLTSKEVSILFNQKYLGNIYSSFQTWMSVHKPNEIQYERQKLIQKMKLLFKKNVGLLKSMSYWKKRTSDASAQRDLWKALEESSPTGGSAESLRKWEKIRKRARAFQMLPAFRDSQNNQEALKEIEKKQDSPIKREIQEVEKQKTTWKKIDVIKFNIPKTSKTVSGFITQKNVPAIERINTQQSEGSSSKKQKFPFQQVYRMKTITFDQIVQRNTTQRGKSISVQQPSKNHQTSPINLCNNHFKSNYSFNSLKQTSPKLAPLNFSKINQRTIDTSNYYTTTSNRNTKSKIFRF